mmetsp:Transcript_11844/g.21376  ORF Transcript_11844/g.21376 Transcript_11844/m.21376 type:complete len:216 (-) Transcript_11844:983-1630(-)
MCHPSLQSSQVSMTPSPSRLPHPWHARSINTGAFGVSRGLVSDLSDITITMGLLGSSNSSSRTSGRRFLALFGGRSCFFAPIDCRKSTILSFDAHGSSTEEGIFVFRQYLKVEGTMDCCGLSSTPRAAISITPSLPCRNQKRHILCRPPLCTPWSTMKWPLYFRIRMDTPGPSAPITAGGIASRLAPIASSHALTFARVVQVSNGGPLNAPRLLY